MKKLLIIIVSLIANYAFGQISHIVIDKETKEKLAYVNIWVENENIGTTSSSNGEFLLPNFTSKRTIVFSSIGYETKRISSDSISYKIELTPQITPLKELTVTPNKKHKYYKVGTFNKSKIHSYYACGTTPWIVARYFSYENEYEETPYLKKIKMLTNSEVKRAKFNIRLYAKNNNGAPGDYIYNENIIGIVEKGKKIGRLILKR